MQRLACDHQIRCTQISQPDDLFHLLNVYLRGGAGSWRRGESSRCRSVVFIASVRE